jgi:hypothetical protein
MRTLVALALLASTLTGCHGSVETTAGGAGGGGGGAPCVSPCTAAITGWTQGGSLLTPRQDHATFVVETPSGAFLYVAGGEGPEIGLRDVERAAIHADGTLGPFAVVAKLPGSAIRSGLAQVGRAVILAGSWESIATATTQVGLVADDGGITFTEGAPLGVTRYALTLSAHGGFVYALGGVHHVYDAQMENTLATDTDAVERAPFDGQALGPFEALAPLPEAVAQHAALVRDDGVYLLGGTWATSGGTAIRRAPFAADGGLGAFAAAGAFVSPRVGTAALAFGGWVFAVGGGSGKSGDDVLRAPFQADGTLGAFDQMPPLPAPRRVRQVPEHGGFAYVAGGGQDDGGGGWSPRGEVFVARLETTSAP